MEKKRTRGVLRERAYVYIWCFCRLILHTTSTQHRLASCTTARELIRENVVCLFALYIDYIHSITIHAQSSVDNYYSNRRGLLGSLAFGDLTLSQRKNSSDFTFRFSFF